MEIKSLLSKYQSIEFKSDGTLFGADLRLATQQKVCPYCFHKIYPMLNRPYYVCKSKSCPKRLSGKSFLISKDKVK